MLHGKVGGISGSNLAAGSRVDGLLICRGKFSRKFILLFKIVIVVAEIAHDDAVGQLDDAGRNPVDKITVMRDTENRTTVRLQGVLKDFLRKDIQMVCRLIENQEVGLREHQLREGQTPPFTAGQVGHALEYIISGEEEGGEGVSYGRVVQCRVSILEFRE